MFRFLILMGYFEMTMYLYITGKLEQYINLHYTYLAFLSMILSFILALVQLVVWMKNLPIHQHTQKKSTQGITVACLLLPLIVTWGFPTVSLDAATVTAKGYYFPLSADTDEKTQELEGTSVQYLKPDTSLYFTTAVYRDEMRQAADRYLKDDVIKITTENYMSVMEAIYVFPDEFVGKKIQLTGFVYNDPDYPNQQFLFRFGIIHCIADSGVYGLLSTGQTKSFDNDTWVQASGTLQMTYHGSLKQSLPSLQLEEIFPISAPKNPYVYRNF